MAILGLVGGCVLLSALNLHRCRCMFRFDLFSPNSEG
jgi:hypothetical protein